MGPQVNSSWHRYFTNYNAQYTGRICAKTDPPQYSSFNTYTNNYTYVDSYTYPNTHTNCHSNNCPNFIAFTISNIRDTTSPYVHAFSNTT